MCVVIDINTLSKVFDSGSPDHVKFKPILDWVIEGKGKLVCGGSKYWDELGKASRYLKVINQLNSARKVAKVNDDEVDQKMENLMSLCVDKNFDDPHIVALAIVSKVRIICSEDARSYPYITNKEWYPKGQSIPKIYKATTYKRARRLLCDKNIADICLPCEKLKKELVASLVGD